MTLLLTKSFCNLSKRLLNDLRITFDELEVMVLSAARGLLYDIVQNHLNFQKVSACSIPNLLIHAYKEKRMKALADILEMKQELDEEFMT